MFLQLTSKNKQVLQIPVVGEHRVVQNNLFEQFDEFVRQVGGHESLHRHRDVLGVLCFWQSCLHNLQILQKKLEFNFESILICLQKSTN